jgi:hypothetical protein
MDGIRPDCLHVGRLTHLLYDVIDGEVFRYVFIGATVGWYD